MSAVEGGELLTVRAGLHKAEKLIAEVDELPADEMVERVGDDNVQRAIEVSAVARDGQQP